MQSTYDQNKILLRCYKLSDLDSVLNAYFSEVKTLILHCICKFLCEPLTPKALFPQVYNKGKWLKNVKSQQWDSNSQPLSYLVRKRTLNHLASLAKWLSVPSQIRWLWVWFPLLPLKLQISCLFRARSSLTFRQP